MIQQNAFKFGAMVRSRSLIDEFALEDFESVKAGFNSARSLLEKIDTGKFPEIKVLIAKTIQAVVTYKFAFIEFESNRRHLYKRGESDFNRSLNYLQTIYLNSKWKSDKKLVDSKAMAADLLVSECREELKAITKQRSFLFTEEELNRMGI